MVFFYECDRGVVLGVMERVCSVGVIERVGCGGHTPPTSASCERDISTRVLAAGWTMSNSFIMVAPSLEMVVLPVGMTLMNIHEYRPSRLTMAIYNQFVHTTWTKGGGNGVHDNLTCIYVANYLGFPLGGVCAFLQKNDWCLLWREEDMMPCWFSDCLHHSIPN